MRLNTMQVSFCTECRNNYKIKIIIQLIIQQLLVIESYSSDIIK